MRQRISMGYCGALAFIALAGGCGDDGETDMAPPAGGSSSQAGSGNAGQSGGGDSGKGSSGSGSAGKSGSGSGGAAANGGRSGSGRGGEGGAGRSGSGGSGESGGGGESGSGGTMSMEVEGSHCSPGTVYHVGGDTPSVIAVESNCDSRDINGDGEEDHINSIVLPGPMVPGEPFAFSGTFVGGAIDAQFWGTDSNCGEARELLASGRVETGKISCFVFNPTMAHTRLLWVWVDGGGSQGSLAICPMGTCEE